MPVQVSHMKLAMKSLWGTADQLLAQLDAARAAGVDITADVYPYDYWQSTLTVLFPERDFTNRDTAEFALSELTTPEGMLIARFDPEPAYVGKTLAEIAKLRGTDPVTTYLDLIAISQKAEGEPNRSSPRAWTSPISRRSSPGRTPTSAPTGLARDVIPAATAPFQGCCASMCGSSACCRWKRRCAR